MTETLDEVAGLLRDSGILANLAADAQAEREVERAALFEKLQAFEKAEAERCAKLATTRAALKQKIEREEISLKAARAELASLENGGSFTIEKLKGKLRRLSDPAYAKATKELEHLFDKARHSFSVGHGVVRGAVRKQQITVSNSLEVAEALASIREARLRIEAMTELPRPDDLPEVLEAIMQPLRETVRKINGFT